ncbi:hypothetical protein [Luteolibacter sp. AS25]|uniref:hypothetical protein n=1 Tax=Luteolibacter sp. AS25 TaxID=3135776 RepID=UPI00398B03DD
MKFFNSLSPALLALALSSCGAVSAVKSTASNATKAVTDFSITDLTSSGVDVVEVREKDLKEMPLGKDRAIAFEKERKRSFWSFALPSDFEEPVLPEFTDGDMDGSLLPPKSSS